MVQTSRNQNSEAPLRLSSTEDDALSRRLPSYALSALFYIALFGFAYGQLSFGGRPTWSTAVLGFTHWWLPALLALTAGLLIMPLFSRGRRRLALSEPLFAASVVVLLLSDVLARRFGFFSGTEARIYIVLLGVLVCAIHWLRWRYERVPDTLLRMFSLPLLLFLQVLTAILFLENADSRILFSDDHPSFWYRLYLLHEQFPNIPFYSSAWEAGYSAREFFASGILNVFLLAAPLWLFDFDLREIETATTVYNGLILYVFVFLAPLANYAAARVLRFDREVAFLAGILALGPSLGQFEWLLRYGTLGFCCSVASLPLSLALAYRLALDVEPPRWYHVAALLVVSFVSISWSLSTFVLLPIAVIGLGYIRVVCAPDRRWLVLSFLLLFFACNVPWILIFIEESKVFSFVEKTALPGAADVVVAKAAHPLRERLQEVLGLARELLAKINPLLLLAVVPGLLQFTNSRLRLVWSSTVAFALFLAFFGEEIKPQLELRRMSIAAAYLSLIPAALAVSALLRSLLSRLQKPQSQPGLWSRMVYVVVLVVVSGFCFFSPLTVAAVYQNRSDEQFRFAPSYLPDIADAIREHGGAGRTFFLGFILHEFGAANWDTQDGGHVAILAALSGKPMYAHFYYHSRWETIDPIPRAIRERGTAAIEEFLDLLNVTAVVTFQREWAEYCRRTPGYREVAQFDRFRVYQRQAAENGFFLSGTGEVVEVLDGFILTPRTSEVRLKYRYLPKLRTAYPSEVELFSYKAFDEDSGARSVQEVRFLGVRVAPERIGKPIHIAYWPERLP